MWQRGCEGSCSALVNGGGQLGLKQFPFGAIMHRSGWRGQRRGTTKRQMRFERSQDRVRWSTDRGKEGRKEGMKEGKRKIGNKPQFGTVITLNAFPTQPILRPPHSSSSGMCGALRKRRAIDRWSPVCLSVGHHHPKSVFQKSPNDRRVAICPRP